MKLTKIRVKRQFICFAKSHRSLIFRDIIGKEKPANNVQLNNTQLFAFMRLNHLISVSIKSNTSIPRTLPYQVALAPYCIITKGHKPLPLYSLGLVFFSIKSTRLAVIPLWPKLKFKMPISAHNQRPLHLLFAKLKPLMTLNEYSLSRTIVS